MRSNNINTSFVFLVAFLYTRCSSGFLSPSLRQYHHHHHSLKVFSDSPTAQRKRRTSNDVALLLSSSTSSSQEDVVEDQKINRQNTTVHRYNLMTVSYVAFAVFQSIKNNNYDASSTCLLAGGMSWILSQAAQNDKLSIDTHKRINMILGMYGILTALTTPPVTSIPSTILLAIWTTLQCLQGYEIGVKGWTVKDKTLFLMKNDWKDSWKRMQRTIRTPISNFQSLYYFVTTLALLLWGIVPRHHPSSSWAPKLWLMTGASLTLKVGADRGSLMETTYIVLNLLLSCAFGTLWSSNSSSACFAVFCALFGAMGFLFQKKKERHYDKLLDNGAYRLSDDFPFQE